MIGWLVKRMAGRTRERIRAHIRPRTHVHTYAHTLTPGRTPGTYGVTIHVLHLGSQVPEIMGRIGVGLGFRCRTTLHKTTIRS